MRPDGRGDPETDEALHLKSEILTEEGMLIASDTASGPSSNSLQCSDD